MEYWTSTFVLKSRLATFSGYFWVILLVLQAHAEQVDAPKFESEIRPILREYCLDCHGATEKPDGSLDLRLVRSMKKGGDSGAAIDSLHLEKSLLLEKVEGDEMPPGEMKLSEEKKAKLRAWVLAGAPTLRPEPESIGPGIPLTEEERSYWAYQPIHSTIKSDSSLPPIEPRNDRVRNGIDIAIAGLMPTGLGIGPEASRATLVKRLYLDLVGLTPSNHEMSRWLSDGGSDWYERLVEELLMSPHYGERWARHWLDAVGYADSDGATLADAERAWAWRYRDYVIRSFNSDKPIDRFITEQLAGDELAGTKQGDWTAEQIELLTATGFLRMAADGTGSGDDSVESRNKTIADTMQIVGSTLLGSSLNCAQCHDHRYDPISHQDYFAIRAVLEPAMDWQHWKTPAQRLVSLYTEEDRRLAAEIESEAQKLSAEKTEKLAEYMGEALEIELKKFSEDQRMALRAAYETPADKRTPEQKDLLDKNPSVNISPGVLYQFLPKRAEELKKYDERIQKVREKKKPEEYVQALVEPENQTTITQLFHRGDPNQPLREVKPGKLSVLVAEGGELQIPDDDTNLPTTGRRLAFARWLVRSDAPNPLFLRSFVNRVWLHHFGRGIVETPGDFGRLGATPTHPQLLDAMAVHLVENRWSLKSLHRWIVQSSVYRQTSARNPIGDKLDPDNRLYWRKPITRLDAEVLRDSMLRISEELDVAMFGPPMALQEDESGQVRVDPGQKRRSIYARWRRTQPVALLQTFDAPAMGINCDLRASSTVPTQSLMMMNGEFSLAQAEKIALRSIANVSSQSTASHIAEGGWDLPKPPEPTWSYGTGKLDSATGVVESFHPLVYFNGTQWQGGSKVPDPAIGWVILRATGGHPGNRMFPAIRRWTAPVDGGLRIVGKLEHKTTNGDGVISSIASGSARLGEWTCANGEVVTELQELKVRAGDTIDFITRCNADENSDSFEWAVQLTLTPDKGAVMEFHSEKEFRGPAEDFTSLPREIVEAWKLVLQREPADPELTLVQEFVTNQLRTYIEEPSRVPAGVSMKTQIVANVCQMLLSSNEFLYVD